MKKAKKLLVFLLAASMILSSVSYGIRAEEVSVYVEETDAAVESGSDFEPARTAEQEEIGSSEEGSDLTSALAEEESDPSGEEGEVLSDPSGEEGEVPSDLSGEEGEVPSDPSGEEGEAPVDPSGEEGEVPSDPSGEEGEVPSDPSGEEGETPAEPSGEEDETPADPSGEKGETPADPSGEEGETPADPSGEEGKAPDDPSGEKEKAPADPSDGTGKTPAGTETSPDKASDETKDPAKAGEDTDKKDSELKTDEEKKDQESADAREEEISGADYSVVAEDGLVVEAVTVTGKAALSADQAAAALSTDTGLDSVSAAETSNELFAALAEGDGDEEEVPEYPRQLDGSNIENISAKWITQDTVNNGDPGLLYVRPGGDSTQQVRLQINYALSGEHNYEPGDVTITIPATIFHKRDGSNTGTMIIPYPQDPSTRQDFNWKRVGDTYVLTNTKRMSAATKGYIQFAIEGMVPHELEDMDVSDAFSAYIQVITHKGNTIALRSNELTAQFDTEAKLTYVTKKRYGSPTRVPASQIPQEWRDKYPDETEFIRVDWYVQGTTEANTLYTLELVDHLADEYNGFLIGATSDDGLELDKGTVYTGYKNGLTTTYSFASAYPASQFEPDVTYTFHNSATMTVTEIDPEKTENTNPNVQTPDPQLVTTQSGSASANYRYSLPTWKTPEGHFMVVKNGNDDHEQNGAAKNNQTHRGTTNRSDSHLWSSAYSSGWYGIYPTGINDLKDQYEDPDIGTDGNIRLSYTIDTVGYVMPWMFDTASYAVDAEIAPRKSVNYTRPVTMTTTDSGISIGRTGEKLTVLEDYTFEELEFPADPWIYSGVPVNINPDGSWTALTAGDGTFRYSRDNDKANWPDIDLEIQTNGGAFEYYGTASWKSGSFVFTYADGTASGDRVIKAPEGMTNFRTTVTLHNPGSNPSRTLQAAIDYDLRVVINLYSTDEMNALIDAAFEQSNTPSFQIWNSTNMTAVRADEIRPGDTDPIVSIDNDGYDSIRGYTTDIMVYPKKTGRQTIREVNWEEGYILIHFSAQVEERSVINDKKTYEEAIAEGRLPSESHGIWRDLLPVGVSVDLDTVRLRKGDTLVDAYVIENYKGSGRDLLVVEADLTPVTTQYRSGDMYYYEDVLSITFDAKYDFEDFKDYGSHMHNVISFESSNDHIGTVERLSGEPDDAGDWDNPGTDENVSTHSAFKDREEHDYMADLDPFRDTPSFVYAGVNLRIDNLAAARTSLTKDVMVNNDGYWSSGVYYDEPEEAPVGNRRTVFEGGHYSYRLRMMSDDSTISKDMIVYDSLENFYASLNYPEGTDQNDPVDVDAPRWHGTLLSVDVSQLIERGCAPVVYYSEVENLQLSDESNPLEGYRANMDLTNAEIWTEASVYMQTHTDLSGVKAVAIDATKSSEWDEEKQEYKDFQLEPLQSVVVLLNMLAPSGDEAREYLSQIGEWGDSAQAYNNAYMICTSIDEVTGIGDSDNFIRKDYTKVGLMESGYHIRKIWSDQNNRDGKRTDVTFRLMAEGKYVVLNTETGVYEYISSMDDLAYDQEPVTLVLPVRTYDPETGVLISEEWEGSIEHIPYTDPDGNVIRYTVVEDVPEGYEAAFTVGERLSTFTNQHIPERVPVSGTKTWAGDDSEETRPEYITVQLYKQGVNDPEPVYVSEKKVTAADGWAWTFANLYKYEDGELISYTVTEIMSGTKAESYLPEADYIWNEETGEWEIVNTYHPYGDLRFTKNVTDVTDVSRGQVFDFTIEFTQTVDEETMPVMGEFAYEIIDLSIPEVDPETGEEQSQVIDTGMIANGDSFQLTGGQVIHVMELPEYISYTIAEEDVAGFSISSQVDTAGTVLPNTTVYSSITNRYHAEGFINLTAEKILENRELLRAQFRFELYEVTLDDEGNEVEERIGTSSNERPSETVTRPDGTVEYSVAPVTFGAIDYDESDAGKTYHYRIREVDSGRDGYTYDMTVYDVTVSVTDNGDGTLSMATEKSCTVQDPETGESETVAVETATYRNRYHAEGDAVLNAWKQLLKRDLQEGEFTFELIGADGNIIAEAQNDASGLAVFNVSLTDALSYTETDIGKVYYFAIREKAGEDPTVNYDQTIYGYAVTVVDNGDGTLSTEIVPVTPVYEAAGASGDGSGDGTGDGSGSETGGEGTGSGSGSETGGDGTGDDGQTAGTSGLVFTDWIAEEAPLPIFVNTLKPGDLALTKTVLNPETADPDQTFTFTVTLIDSGLEDGEISYTVYTELDADNNPADPQEKTAEMEGGIFRITLKDGETALFTGIPAGTAYQISEQTIDEWLIYGQANVSGMIESLETAEAEVTNKYQPGVTSVQFTGTKTLDGKAAQAEAFTFSLYEIEGANRRLVQTVPTQAGGFIQFDAIEYEEEGTHEYKIIENDPGIETIDFDQHIETIAVVVTKDPETGKLSAAVTYSDDQDEEDERIAFINRTRPGTLELTKRVQGQSDANKDDEFTFRITLSNADGMPLGEGNKIYWYVRDKDGNIKTKEEEQQEPAPEPGPEETNVTPGAAEASGAAAEGKEPVRAQANYQKINVLQIANRTIVRDSLGGGSVAGATISNTVSNGGITADLYSNGVLVIHPTNGTEVTASASSLNAVVTNLKKSCNYVRFEGTIHLTGYSAWLFRYCTAKVIDFYGLDTSRLSTGDNGGWVCDCPNLEVVNFDVDWSFSQPSSGQHFARNPKLKYLILGPKATFERFTSTWYQVFYNNPSLEYLDLSMLKTTIKNTSTFAGDTKLAVVVLGENIKFSATGGMPTTHKNAAGQTVTTYWVRLGDEENARLTTSQLFSSSYNGATMAGTWYWEDVDPSNYGMKTTVHFDANGGAGPQMDDMVSVGSCVLPECTYTNYDLLFIGWAKDSDAVEGQYQPGNSFSGTYGQTTTLYAIWASPNSFVVQLNANGGFVSPQRIRVNDPESTVNLPVPTHPSGFEFLNWNTEQDGTGTSFSEVVYGTELNGEPGSVVQLYAQFLDPAAGLLLKVEHYQEKADGSGYDGPVLIERTPLPQGTEITPETQSYPGFVAPETQTVTMDTGKTVKYYYDRVRYTLKFDGNGATSGQMNDLTLVGAVAENLPKNNYQKTGAIFTGWNKEEDGSGTTYTDKQQVLNMTDENGAVITLYAQWLTNEDDVLEPTNGVIEVTCKADETIILPGIPAGTTYVIEEIGVPDGWTQTGIVDGNGSIVANETSSATVTNQYSASGEASLLAHKKLEYGDLSAGQFSFDLLDVNENVLQTRTNEEVDTEATINGEDDEVLDNPWVGTAPVEFDPIQFTEPGTYTFYIREVVKTGDNVRYDTHVETVTVTMTDAGHGLLKAKVTYDDDGALFTNAWNPTDLKISKTTVGSEDGAATPFQFQVTLTGSDGNPLEGTFQARRYYAEPLVVDGTGTVMKKSHSSNVTDDGTCTGVYENNTAVKDIVTIPGAESLHVKLQYATEDDHDYVFVFNGAYTGAIAASMTGYTGRYTGYNGNSLIPIVEEFDVPGSSVTFGFATDNSNNLYYGYYAEVTASVAGEGTVSYEDLTVTSGDTVTLLGGEYMEIYSIPNGSSYSVSEVNILEYWEQTSATDTEGTLQAGTVSEAAFTNTYTTPPPPPPYTASGSIGLQAKKIVQNGTILESDEFTFELLDVEGNVLQTKTADAFNTAESTITFDAINYNEDDIMYRVYYAMKLYVGNEVYDITDFDVVEDYDARTVTISGNGVWNILPEQAVVKLFADGEEQTEQTVVLKNSNSYDFSFEGLPIFSDSEQTQEVSYALQLVAGDHSYMIQRFDRTENGEDGSITISGTWTISAEPAYITVVAGDAEIASKEIELNGNTSYEYLFPDIPMYNGGMFTYYIREVVGTDENVTYDTTRYIATVEVSDTDKDGVIETAVSFSRPGQSTYDDDGNEIFHDDPVDEAAFTNIKLANVRVRKVDAETMEPLEGVTFQIRKTAGADETTIGCYLNPDGTLTEEPYTFSSSSNGTFQIRGMTEGTFVITEIRTKDGYNMPDDPNTTFEVKDGSVLVDDTVTAQITITNEKGYHLPDTGGIGTEWFRMFGLLLMAAAGGAFLWRRRREACTRSGK